MLKIFSRSSRVTQENCCQKSEKNDAAGNSCAAAPAGAQRAEEPRHQVRLPAPPGRIRRQPSTVLPKRSPCLKGLFLKKGIWG